LQPKGREFEPRTLHSFLHGSHLLPHICGAIELARAMPDSMSDAMPGLGVDSPLYVAIRAAMYLAALTVIGSCAFILLIATRVSHLAGSDLELSAVVPATRALARWASVVLALAMIARLLAQGYMVSEGESMFMMPMLTSTVWGWGWLLGAAATAVICTAFFIGSGRRYTWRIAAAGTMALALSFSITGHAASTHNAVVHVIFDATHVMAAGGWVGTLLVVATIGLRTVLMLPVEKRAHAAAELINAFSIFALTCVIMLVATGIIAAWSHLPTISALWTTSYGSALFRKLVFISLTGLVGAFNWLYVKPRLTKAETISTLRKSAAVELAIGLVVVVMTAILVGTSPPDADDGAPAAAQRVPSSTSLSQILPS
jgi:putative copper export protein